VPRPHSVSMAKGMISSIAGGGRLRGHLTNAIDNCGDHLRPDPDGVHRSRILVNAHVHHGGGRALAVHAASALPDDQELVSLERALPYHWPIGRHLQRAGAHRSGDDRGELRLVSVGGEKCVRVGLGYRWLQRNQTNVIFLPMHLRVAEPSGHELQCSDPAAMDTATHSPPHCEPADPEALLHPTESLKAAA